MATNNWWDSVPLHNSLLICAGQHASAAYEIVTEQDPRAASFAAARASIHAGAAVELLAKSLLAKEHPALIMEKPADAFPAKKNPLDLEKTADASTLQRLLCAHLDLNEKVQALGGLILKDRNKAAHGGLSARGLTETVDLLGLWIHYVQEASGLVPTDWLAGNAADEQERRFNAFIVQLHAKLRAATDVFEKRRRSRQKATNDFEDWATQLERELAESAPNEIGPDFNEQQECPACKRTGQMWGVIDDIDYEYEGPGEYSEHVIWSAYFRCPVCTLELNDPEFVTVLDPGWSDLIARFEMLPA